MRIAALALIALAAAGCGSETSAPPTPDAQAPTGGAVAAPTPTPVPLTGPGSVAPVDAYPMTTCVVSGEALGAMGATVNYQHEGVEVRFCCNNCIADFKKDPAKYMAILEAARKK